MQALNVVGFESEWKTINHLINHDRLPHAILLSGKKSIGKAQFAKKIALHFFEENFKKNKNGKSFTALLEMIVSNSFPDLYLIKEEESKNNISVEQIRELINNLSLKSYYNIGSVVIIDNAEKLSISAANSLLKILEEPEKNKLFILISSQTQNLIETIHSRTQNFLCNSRTSSEIEIILKTLCPDLSSSSISELQLILGDSLELLNLENMQSKIDYNQYINNRIKFLRDTKNRIEKILIINDSISRKSQIIQFLRSADKDSILKKTYMTLLLSSIKERIRKSDLYKSAELTNLQLNILKNNHDMNSRHLDLETQISQFI